MTNPLIEKFYELHPEKKEKLKKVKYELDPEFVKQIENKSTLPIDPTTKNPPSLKTFDNPSSNDTFLQIAGKIMNGEAQVLSMSMEMGYSIGKYCSSKTITFEVRVYEP
jgi:hypothetical protein